MVRSWRAPRLAAACACGVGAFAGAAGWGVAEPPPAAVAPAGPPSAAAIYQAVRPSIVRIDSAGGVGAGFLFHSRRHVATALHVVEAGRDVEVRLVDGRTHAARVVAVDDEHDLAILALDEPVGLDGAEPLVPVEGDRPAEVGRTVYVVGHPFAPQAALDRRLRGVLDWSLSTGVVSAATGDLVQVEAAVNPGNSGGPVLDEQGRLVGVVSFEIRHGDGLGFAIAARRLSDLALRIDEGLAWWGVWAGEVGFGVVGDVDAGSGGVLGAAGGPGGPAGLVGLAAGVSATGWDRLAVWARAAELAEQASPEGYPRTERQRGLVEVGAAWRFLVVVGAVAPVHLVLGGGAAYEIDRTTVVRRHTTYADPACPTARPTPAGGCEVRDRIARDPSDRSAFVPFATAGLRLGGLDLSYALRLPADGAPAGHRFVLGVWF